MQLANEPSRLTIFWPALWLGVACAAGKLTSFGLPGQTDLVALGTWASDVLTITSADVVFVLACALAVRLLLWTARSRPRLQQAIRVGWLAFCGVGVLYAMASVEIFAQVHAPLTYPLIYLAGDPKNISSSLDAYVTPWVLARLILAPLLFGVLVVVAPRYVRLPVRPRLARLYGIGLVLVLGQMAHAWWAWNDRWRWHFDHRLAESPHWALINSCAKELAGGDALRFNEEFPREYLADFQTAAQRKARPVLRIDSQLRPRNVILLVMESVGRQWLNVYGAPYNATPHIEQESMHSLVFDNVYAQTGRTTASLVQLTLSVHTPVSWRDPTCERPDIPGVSLAQALKARGFRTAFITPGDLSWANEEGFLVNRGFDQILQSRDMGPPICSWGAGDDQLVDHALRWIERGRAQPFFVMGWTNQTHHPYALSSGQVEADFLQGRPAPSAFLNRYLSVLQETDRQVKRLLDGLRQAGLADDTLVAIVGDHGESFGVPHETYFHGQSVYQQDVAVPCILWNPRLYGAGQRSGRVGNLIDVAPTILDLLGFAPAGPWQGRSLFDQEHPNRAYLFSAWHDYVLGIRQDQYKYVYNAATGASQLFDLDADPEEKTDLAVRNERLCTQLRQRLSAWIGHQRQSGPARAATVPTTKGD